ncbi:hypothetical protein DJ90_5573 [Paenibacillus macerans]|uniref:Uncharacterized protein n=1 Tax=Paenibacillus macerans TaxID=44252 RepID=A0A090XHJ3_PAEMA|nr:hypothetical protein DJ90_5573 [Paenibacillus macerans]
MRHLLSTVSIFTCQSHIKTTISVYQRIHFVVNPYCRRGTGIICKMLY